MQIMQELPTNKPNFLFKHTQDFNEITHVASYWAMVFIVINISFYFNYCYYVSKLIERVTSWSCHGDFCCIISQLWLHTRQSEIHNVLTTIHSFSSKQWMTQRQCVYELSHWHNTQLICVKCVKNSWMIISSVRISYPAECNCHLL